MADPQMTPIFHFTHLDNLPTILECGGLCCKNRSQREGRKYVNCAHQSIQDQRARKDVQCAPFGVLHDYVPFYFGPRSPMMFAISKNNVPAYTGGQAPLIYLCSVAEVVATKPLPFVFTDGHPITQGLSDFYNDLRWLNKIDWQVVKGKWWNQTESDPDRPRRRMAEFLVHDMLPWSMVYFIGTFDQATADEVTRRIQNQTWLPKVEVKRDWYY